MQKTELEIKREKEFEKVKDNIVFVVINNKKTPDSILRVESQYGSLDDAMHKLKLDMMLLALCNDFTIEVNIKRKQNVRA